MDWEKCNACGLCIRDCPAEYVSKFERGLGVRKAIDLRYPQSVPNQPVIDRSQCRYFIDGSCKRCEEICPEKAIRFKQEEEKIVKKVGAIVVATGYELYPKEELGEYGYGEIPDVIDGLALERMLSADGPTGGKIVRPSDGKVPKEMVFIQCVASRDPDRYMPYCSRICCMYKMNRIFSKNSIGFLRKDITSLSRLNAIKWKNKSAASTRKRYLTM